MKIEKEKYLNGLDKVDKIWLSNILDKYERYIKTGKSSTTDFLDRRKQTLIKTRLPFIFPTAYFYQVDELCEKVVLCFGQNQESVTLYYAKAPNMKHNKVLKTLFLLGFEPDTIGDIWVEKEGFYLTNLTRLNRYLEDNFVLVDNQLIHLEVKESLDLKEEHFIDQKIILSSLRLDNLVSKLKQTSRKEALKCLQNQQVLYNYQVNTSPSIFIKEGDVLSIRHVGKFLVSKIEGVTKKNKIIIKVKKYK